MYALVRTLDNRTVAAREVVTFAAALALAETTYKFHSFTLECGAFLATWAGLSAAAALVARVVAPPRPDRVQ